MISTREIEIFKRVKSFEEVKKDGHTIAILKNKQKHLIKKDYDTVLEMYQQWAASLGFQAKNINSEVDKALNRAAKQMGINTSPDEMLRLALIEILNQTLAMGIVGKCTPEEAVAKMSDYEVAQIWAEAKYYHDQERQANLQKGNNRTTGITAPWNC